MENLESSDISNYQLKGRRVDPRLLQVRIQNKVLCVCLLDVHGDSCGQVGTVG